MACWEANLAKLVSFGFGERPYLKKQGREQLRERTDVELWPPHAYAHTFTCASTHTNEHTYTCTQVHRRKEDGDKVYRLPDVPGACNVQGTWLRGNLGSSEFCFLLPV